MRLRSAHCSGRRSPISAYMRDYCLDVQRQRRLLDGIAGLFPLPSVACRETGRAAKPSREASQAVVLTRGVCSVSANDDAESNETDGGSAPNGSQRKRPACAWITRTAARTKSALSRAWVPSGSNVTSSRPVRIPCPLSSARWLTAQLAMPSP